MRGEAVSRKPKAAPPEAGAPPAKPDECGFTGPRSDDLISEETVRWLRAADDGLAALIERVGPIHFGLLPRKSPYEALAEAIVYQQLSGGAARAITGRLRALGGGRFPRPDALLAAPDLALRGAGLSRPKVLSLRDLAARTLDGVVPSLARLRRMADDEIVERLDPIRGIGRWTVEMLLIFRLGRPDVLPVDDFGIRKGFSRAFHTRDLPPPARVARRGERWRPFRTAASLYLWQACRLP